MRERLPRKRRKPHLHTRTPLSQLPSSASMGTGAALTWSLLLLEPRGTRLPQEARLGAQGPPTTLPRPCVSPGSRVRGGPKPRGGPEIQNLAQPGRLSHAALSPAGGLGM